MKGLLPRAPLSVGLTVTRFDGGEKWASSAETSQGFTGEQVGAPLRGREQERRWELINIKYHEGGKTSVLLKTHKTLNVLHQGYGRVTRQEAKV